MSYIDPSVSSVNKSLYRPLRDGAAYESLIPKHIKIVNDFDKESDRVNTYETLKYMAEWAYKYAYQMKAVAPLLKGRLLQETVNKIYEFLYSHFQYKLDGPDFQDILAPSAAWHFRRTGFDCKTYSILASTILQNLGIPHSFRMVQQAGIMPGEWSHVYVIVPNGNTHLVIDATTHTNKEVSYTNKHDYTMKHRGLASPYVGALGCACQGTPIRSNGLGSPSTLANTIKNFHVFLDQLEKQGISKEVTARMLTIVRANVENGIDPIMGEVLKKALATTSTLGYTFDPLPSLTSAGSTYGGFSTSMPTGNYYTPQPSAFSTAFSQVKTQATAAGTSALSNFSIAGVSAGTIMAAAAGDPMAMASAALTILKKIIPVDKTFGAVFANGMKLSCWGSSTPPSLTKTWVANDLPIVYAKTVGAGITQQNLNLFIDTMNKMTTVANNWAADMKPCSQDGLHQYAEAAKNAKDQVITELKNIVQLVPQGSVHIPGRVLPIKLSDIKFSDAMDEFDSERYQIVFNQPTNTENQNAQQPTAGSTNTNTNTATNTDTTGATPSTAKKSGVSTPLILGAGLLALKLFL